MATTVRSLLGSCRLPRLEGRMLLRHVLRVPQVWLMAHDTDMVDAASAARFQDLVQQRLAGRPMAYLIGEREFMGHVFRVAPDVLIPRPETELLVETAIRHLALLDSPQPCVLDLGTGSGAVAISIALACPRARVVATDISDRALAVAAENAAALGAKVQFFCGSWYEPVPPQSLFDVIVANPPYVAAHDPHLVQGDLRFEPMLALTDGADGLTALTDIARGAPARLRAGGVLWMEHGWDQAPAVRSLLQGTGFQRVRSLNDLAGIERITGGSL